jgi:hypothetical protein
MNPVAMHEGIAEARHLLSADGADLTLIEASDRGVHLALDLSGVECLDCVLPHEYLRDTIADIVGRHVGTDVSVELEDPRLAPDSDAGDAH